MDDIEKKVYSYPSLSADEQRRVERYVEAHPEWASLLQDVRALEGMAAGPEDDLWEDDLVGLYVVAEHLHPEEAPAVLQSAFSQMQQRLDEDERLQKQVEAARSRLSEAEAAVDPVAQFEALTEHSLEGPAESTAARAEASEGSQNSVLSVLDRMLSLPWLVRRGAVALAVLVGAYGALYAVSVGTQSPLERLARVDISDDVVQSYASTETRSALPGGDSAATDQQYIDALQTLRSARTSTLGLFPQYDASKLDRAKTGLEHVLEEVPPGSFLALEAHFYLGKVALARGDVAAAKRHLEVVVERDGRKRAEAQDILTSLQEHAAPPDQ